MLGAPVKLRAHHTRRPHDDTTISLWRDRQLQRLLGSVEKKTPCQMYK
jgi:hypothetical protein